MPESAHTAVGGEAAAAQIADPASSGAGAVKPVVFAEGLLAAFASFVIWGAFPFYLKPIYHVPSMQIIAHRVAWACVLCVIWLAVRGDIGSLRKLFGDRAIVGRLAISAL